MRSRTKRAKETSSHGRGLARVVPVRPRRWRLAIAIRRSSLCAIHNRLTVAALDAHTRRSGSGNSKVLSYQHDYHVGNHADVLKHVVLTLLIEALQRKPAPIRVVDTHAGSGIYDLRGALTQRHREYENGVARVLEGKTPVPELASYVRALRTLNPNGELRRYPGSPQIAKMLLRPQDHLELFELHPQAHAALTAHFKGDRQTHVHRRDAFEGVAAVLPPPERRGLVLVDPSYETEREFVNVLGMLEAAQRRWPTGVYAIWYPLIGKLRAARFLARLEALPLPRLFQMELTLATPDSVGLRGSGIVIANLPFELDEPLARVAAWLHEQLAQPSAGGWRARWLAEP
jgi:23S rRNA (adenine2030-N6)-methyltransferase